MICIGKHLHALDSDGSFRMKINLHEKPGYETTISNRLPKHLQEPSSLLLIFLAAKPFVAVIVPT